LRWKLKAEFAKFHGMEEIEDPTESLQENIREEAGQKRERLSLYVALSTAIMAVLAALSGLMAGHHANEALIEQIKAADQWAYYQSRGIKSEIDLSTTTIIKSFSGKIPLEYENKKVERYEKEKEDIRTKAEESEKSSALHLNKHTILSRAVTLFQVAIAVAAISVLTRKRILWLISIGLALIGLIFLVQGIIYHAV